MTRQWVNAPGTEAHARRFDHMKGLVTPVERKAYLDQVRSEHGHFWRDYLADDFATWWASRKKEAA